MTDAERAQELRRLAVQWYCKRDGLESEYTFVDNAFDVNVIQLIAAIRRDQIEKDAQITENSASARVVREGMMCEAIPYYIASEIRAQLDGK